MSSLILARGPVAMHGMRHASFRQAMHSSFRLLLRTSISTAYAIYWRHGFSGHCLVEPPPPQQRVPTESPSTDRSAASFGCLEPKDIASGSGPRIYPTQLLNRPSRVRHGVISRVCLIQLQHSVPVVVVVVVAWSSIIRPHIGHNLLTRLASPHSSPQSSSARPYPPPSRQPS